MNLLQLPLATLEGGLARGPRPLGFAGPSAALGKIVGLSRDDVGCSIDRNHDHLQSMVDDAMRLDGTRRSNCHIAAAPHFADHRPWVLGSVNFRLTKAAPSIVVPILFHSRARVQLEHHLQICDGISCGEIARV